ncbi:MAG: UDP-glucose 4-epimerase GalE [Burkholderiaceae bacterium]|nr:UDP-glucose 4-epimerase GalE [Burkholderiaceae bacterium]
MTSAILVTGGAGFIGSHTTVALQQAGYRVLILDNLCNSRFTVLQRIEQITGVAPGFIQADIRDAGALKATFQAHKITAVLHFAGLKAVGESTQKPLDYYDNNVNGSVQLLKAMQQAKVYTFVFSSSATVYGDPQELPLTELHPRSATNPYGHSKLVVEDILENLYKAETGWRIARLRYFNPVGAHPSALIGESPEGVPNNLMPYVAQVAIGQQATLKIFGDDYDTADGTGVRDYIHVMDLAQGHVAALRYCEQTQQDLLTVNLGTGQGYSVLDMVRAFEQASQKIVDYKVVARRPGDIAACWADTRLAKQKLGWQASKNINTMCEDAWRWQLAMKTGIP